jgi:hypothetical protein
VRARARTNTHTHTQTVSDAFSLCAVVDQATLPTYMSYFPILRSILLRERIRIVHGHAATSTLIHDCIMQAKIMGYKVGAATVP